MKGQVTACFSDSIAFFYPCLLQRGQKLKKNRMRKMLNKLQYILTSLGWVAFAHQSTPLLLIEVHVQSGWALLILAQLFDHTEKKNGCFFTYQDTLKTLDYLWPHNFTLLGPLILLFLRNTGTAVFMQSNSWPGWRAEQKCTPLIHVDIKIFCFVLFFTLTAHFQSGCTSQINSSDIQRPILRIGSPVRGL